MTTHRIINAAMLRNELEFGVSRSSGPGGQNVNKVNSKVTLRFNIMRSSVLTGGEKEIITSKLTNRITGEGELVLTSQDQRSQIQNKDEVTLKLVNLLNKTLEKKKKRKATKPTRSSAQKRITAKKKHSEKKGWRRGV